MTNTASKIKKIGLGKLNAWKISIDINKKKSHYIITPAHNIIYKPDGFNWKPSPFIMGIKNYQTNWYVSKKYLSSSEYNLEYDLAWKPIEYKNKSLNSSLETEFVNPEQIYDIKYYYYQPYNFDGIKISKALNDSWSLGCGSGNMYQSPGIKFGFESIWMGFRGMSGAIVTNQYSNKCVGMFVRTIKNLGTVKTDSTVQTELNGIPRGFIMSTNMIVQIITQSESEKIL